MRSNGLFPSAFLEGVADIPSEHIKSATDDAKRTGLQAMVGPFRVEAFERALKLSGGSQSNVRPRDDDGRIAQREIAINPRFALATAWSEGRFENARNLLEKGREPPPIVVSESIFPGLPAFYHVVDGMHRAVAARMSGRVEVRATLCGSWQCDPHSARIINGYFWKRMEETDGWRPGLSDGREPDDVCDAMDALGVDVRWSLLHRLRRRIRPRYLKV